MKFSKYLLLRLILLVLLAATVLLSSGCMNIQVENSSVELSKYIERIRQGKVDELSLTIYYMNPYIMTLLPVTKRDLIKNWYELKVTVSGERLSEHIELLEQIANADLTPVEQEPYEFVRLYYVFKTKWNRKIFSVCMWSGSEDIYVNGIQVEKNEVFYEVVMPFLPEDDAEKVEAYMKYGLGGLEE